MRAANQGFSFRMRVFSFQSGLLVSEAVHDPECPIGPSFLDEDGHQKSRLSWGTRKSLVADIPMPNPTRFRRSASCC